MYRRLLRHTAVTFGVGLLAGLLVGGGMLVGSLVTQSTSASHREFLETALHAQTTHGGETMAIATGQIDDGLDGAFFIDYVTGQLSAMVISRRSGAVVGQFAYNVVNDLGAERGKKPSYLLVAGQLSFLRGSSPVRLADSAIYVADANSGRFAVYTLPWDRSLEAQNQPQAGAFQLIHKGSIRNVAIRNQ